MDLDFDDAKRVFEALSPKEKASELKDIEFAIKVKKQDVSTKKQALKTKRILRETVKTNLRKDLLKRKQKVFERMLAGGGGGKGGIKKATKKLNIKTGEVTPII